MSAKLFSMDTIGMYANISTKHALQVIRHYLEKHSDKLKDFKLPIPFILKCLGIIMTSNIFTFGGITWQKRNGTAMGTRCAVNYAFLYVGLLEIEELLPYFKRWLLYYGRYIDDSIGLWNTHKARRQQAWKDFKTRLNGWGNLR